MAASLSRKLTSKLHLLQNPSSLFNSFKTISTIPKPYPLIPVPIPNSSHFRPHPLFHLTISKPFSTKPPDNPNPNPNDHQQTESPSVDPDVSSPNPNPIPDFLHQEIVGPTVDRDESALANETRQVLETLSRSMFRLSNTLALLGVANLGLGAFVAYSMKLPAEVTVQGIAAFAFPFSMAFLLRRSLVPIIFFRKMEELGRLQILTLTLQVSKTLNVMVVRIGTASVCCALIISAGALVMPWLR